MFVLASFWLIFGGIWAGNSLQFEALKLKLDIKVNIVIPQVRTNDDFCIKNDELCIENEELCIKILDFAGRHPHDPGLLKGSRREPRQAGGDPATVLLRIWAVFLPFCSLFAHSSLTFC